MDKSESVATKAIGVRLGGFGRLGKSVKGGSCHGTGVGLDILGRLGFGWRRLKGLVGLRSDDY